MTAGDETTEAPKVPKAREIALRATTIVDVAARSGWGAETVASANVLITPTYVRQISALHQVTLERLDVRVPDRGRNEWETEDLYTMQGKLAPTKHLLERVALLAGVEWDVARCRFDVILPELVVYTAVGGIRGPGGKMVWIPASKEWNRDVEYAEIDERAKGLKVWSDEVRRKVEATPEQRADYIAKERARAAKHRIPMTESKARLRVLRALLGIAGAADADYWKRPFLIPRIDVVLDPNDPHVRERLLEEGLGARRLLGYDPPTSDGYGASVAMTQHDDGSIEVDAIEIHDPIVEDPEPIERDPEVVAAGEVVIPAAFGGGDRSIEDLWSGDQATQSIVRNVAKLPPGINDELRAAAALWIAAIAVEGLG